MNMLPPVKGVMETRRPVPAAAAVDPAAAPVPPREPALTKPEPPHAGALRRFVAALPSRQMAADTVLFRQGGPIDTLFYAVDGIVETTMALKDGSEVVVGHHRAGSFVGDLVRRAGGVRRCTARTLTPARIVAVDDADFRRRLDEDGTLVVGLLSEIAVSAESLVGQTNDLKMRSLQQRLAGYLLDVSGEQGTAVFRLPLAKMDLARWLGTTPQALSRAFAALRKIGVSVKGRTVAIANADCVRTYCNDY